MITNVYDLDATDRAIILATQAGLPLVPEPYAVVAADVGIPLDDLFRRLRRMIAAGAIRRIAAVPKNQLMMMKLVVNQSVESMGLAQTQMFASLFDGIARHSPEGVWFKQRAEEKGFKEAVRERDSGEPIAQGVSKPFYRF